MLSPENCNLAGRYVFKILFAFKYFFYIVLVIAAIPLFDFFLFA